MSKIYDEKIVRTERMIQKKQKSFHYDEFKPIKFIKVKKQKKFYEEQESTPDEDFVDSILYDNKNDIIW